MISNWAYVTGGTLAPDAPSYVERGADRDLLAHLESGETCYVLNSRQMGKSSLCVRTIGRLKDQGVRTVFCDLTKFGGRNLTAEQWYAALLSEMGRDLGLRSEFLAYWKDNADLPAVQRLFGALVEEGLEDDSPMVVFIDEIDVTLSLPFSADEFFAAIRQCYVGRATDERLKRLSFCLLGTATPADLIQDTRVSPFNIGKRIELLDFTAKEAAPLAAGVGDSALLDRVLHWTGGHPYLTQRLCQAVLDSSSKDVDQVCSELFLTHSAKESDDNLAFVRNRLLKSEADLSALLDLYRRMRSGKPVQDDETNSLCAILKLSGVAKVEGGHLKVRNRIYEHVFDRQWVETHMPDAEKRRQREAYRKGLFRAAAVGVGVVGAIGVLAIQAMRAGIATEVARKELDYQLYVAKMNNLQIFYDEGNVAQVSKVLEETKSNIHKGWEWEYWQSLLQDSKEQYLLESGSDPLQHALFSHDASEIMFVDRISNRAILVNRKTKRVAASYRLEKNEYLQKVGGGWVAWSDMRESLRVRDLVSDSIRFSYPIQPGSQGFIGGPRKSSGFLIVYQLSPTGTMTTSIIDKVSGETLWPHGVKSSSQTSENIASISADGSRLLVAKFNIITALTGTYVVRHRDGRILDELTVSRNVGFSSVMSPSGRYWICADGERLLLRDLATRTTRQIIETGPHGRFQSAEFDFSESKIVFTTEESKAVVWSIPQGKELAVYRGVFLVDVSMNTDEVLLSGDMIRVVSLSPGSQQGNLVNYVSWGLNGCIVIQASDSLRLVSDPDLKDVRRIELKGGGLAASDNGRVYATFESSNKGREAVLRETESGKVLARSKIGWYSVEAADSHDLIATLTSDNRVAEVRRFGDSEPLWKQTAVTGERIYQALMSPDGNLVLTSKMSGAMSSAVIHDARTGKPLKSVSGSYPTVGFVHGSNDYWISLGVTLKVFSNVSHKLVYELPADFNVFRVIQSPDGRRILTVGGARTGTNIWDKTSRQRLCRIPGFNAGCFTRDGQTLVGTRDNRLKFYKVGSPNPVTRIAVHQTHPVPSAKAP